MSDDTPPRLLPFSLSEEPYFRPANSPNFLSGHESAIDNNQRFRQMQKFNFYRNAIDYLVANTLSGSYFEFGVHRARTFTMAMSLDRFYGDNNLANGAMAVRGGGGYFDEYVAFDSFQGFPNGTESSEHPSYREGYVSTSRSDFLRLLTNYGQNLERVRCVSGWYSESLTVELAQEFRTRKSKVSFVAFDCNLYESYKSSLVWCDEFLQPGAVIYLDDFHTYRSQPDRGPRLAWNEFQSLSRWTFEKWHEVGCVGRSYIVQSRG